METYLVYSLVNPETLEPRYIGHTRRSLKQRLYEHLNYQQNDLLKEWIDDLSDKGLKPKIMQLDKIILNTTLDESRNRKLVERRESDWMRYFFRKRADLLNRFIPGLHGKMSQRKRVIGKWKAHWEKVDRRGKGRQAALIVEKEKPSHL